MSKIWINDPALSLYKSVFGSLGDREDLEEKIGVTRRSAAPHCVYGYGLETYLLGSKLGGDE